MAEEEAVVVEGSSPPSDHKRKLDDLGAAPTLEEEPYTAENDEGHALSDSSPDGKRPRLDDYPELSVTEALTHGNGYQDEKGDDAVPESDAGATVVNSEAEEAQQQQQPKDSEENADDGKPSLENHDAEDVNQESDDNVQETSKEEVLPSEGLGQQEEHVSGDGHTMTRKIEVPNNKVGVLIGKAGDTIRYLQYNSGAKIQIVRDAEADLSSATRPVELMGSLDSINKAEKLIRDVIAEAEAGGSPSLVARGIATAQGSGAAEQIEIKVPNEKVGIIIGRGGDTIKGLQTRSGARIQLIPQHLPEGDESKERIVRVTGDKRQIDIATEMIKEVMKQSPRQSSLSGGFGQQSYRSRGPSGPQWGQRAPYTAQGMPYDYQQRGQYPSQNPQYPPPSYGGYPPPRSGFGAGWDQRPPSMQGPPPHGRSYDYYGGHGGHQASGPHSGPVPGHGPLQSQASYNYGQSRGANYGHPGPYSQGGNAQQGYGHGYDESKYDNAPVHQSYGGQSTQPVYSQAPAAQPGYPQQYGKPPSYGMPQQGMHPQSYGTPTGSQPGEMPYPGSGQATQPYGSSLPTQQTYQYPASGPMQQTYAAYGGSAQTTDGYSQPLPQSGTAYPQQGQPTPGYGQPATAGAYAAYPEQPAAAAAAAANANYGYQASQDAVYGSAPGATYTAAPTPSAQTQPAYAQQPATAQPGYDQSVAQSGGYGSVPVTAQASYPQYDSAQAYGAAR